MTRVALVPGVLALLPQYAGLADPVAELRAACRDAVAWLVEAAPGEVVVLADPQGQRVAEHLLVEAGFAGWVSTDGGPADGGGAAYLVVANGSARRSEKAPGHLDERSFAFDEALGKALTLPDPVALSELDVALGAELLAGGLDGLRRLGDVLTDRHTATVDHDDDPFGVQYWVMRWTCGS